MIRLAVEADIHEVIPRLRAQELATIVRLGLDPVSLIRQALGPFAYSGLADGCVACMWGIKFDASLGNFPRLWLITTPLVERHKIEFLRESRRFVTWAHAEFGVIEGCVDCQNIVSMHWLCWLGFASVETVGGYVRMRTNGY